MYCCLLFYLFIFLICLKIIHLPNCTSVKMIRTCQPQTSNGVSSSGTRTAKSDSMLLSNKVYHTVVSCHTRLDMYHNSISLTVLTESYSKQTNPHIFGYRMKKSQKQKFKKSQNWKDYILLGNIL